MKVLVSGAGVAGLSAGIALGRDGHEVTIVERAPHARTTGLPIDVRGDAITVAREFSILDELRDCAVDMTARACAVDATGAVIANMPVEEISDSPDDIEISREDLNRILTGALLSTTDVRFGEWITDLNNTGSGVDVTFRSGERDTFDLLVGADGIHSATRRMVFGPEQQFVQHLGLYIAVAKLDTAPNEDRMTAGYNFPSHLAAVAHYRDQARALFYFRSEWIDYDYHDIAEQQSILSEQYAGHNAWRIPELLEAVHNDPDLYFDTVSQVHMPKWHTGRVVLIGDAAACASPLAGRGTSLAMTAASILAAELAATPNDIDRALSEYERRQRPYVKHAQASVTAGADLLCPADQATIDGRNAALRASRG